MYLFIYLFAIWIKKQNTVVVLISQTAPLNKRDTNYSKQTPQCYTRKCNDAVQNKNNNNKKKNTWVGFLFHVCSSGGLKSE